MTILGFDVGGRAGTTVSCLYISAEADEEMPKTKKAGGNLPLFGRTFLPEQYNRKLTFRRANRPHRPPRPPALHRAGKAPVGVTRPKPPSPLSQCLDSRTEIAQGHFCMSCPPQQPGSLEILAALLPDCRQYVRNVNSAWGACTPALCPLLGAPHISTLGILKSPQRNNGLRGALAVE